ncbi:GDSL esterase/lipase [Camellia lanceoleosa]|uniref:GDSL esterase/lipase n=1 Tax=Camellia lanceoleosa TaxID=1840588 RepID=A0ACC0GR27_9ERIC|nr:GDSL esterase/lipase [Camellia lanceoleosa]
MGVASKAGDWAFKAFTAGLGVATIYLAATFFVNVYRGFSWHNAESVSLSLSLSLSHTHTHTHTHTQPYDICLLATQNSLGGLVMSAMGKESEEPMHLIPSANLVVNLFLAQDMKQAHGIHQWWRPDLNLQSKVSDSEIVLVTVCWDLPCVWGLWWIVFWITLGSEPPYSKALSLDDDEKRATKPIAAPPPPSPPPMPAAAAEKHSLPIASGNPYWTADGLPLGHDSVMGEPLCRAQ